MSTSIDARTILTFLKKCNQISIKSKLFCCFNVSVEYYIIILIKTTLLNSAKTTCACFHTVTLTTGVQQAFITSPNAV